MMQMGLFGWGKNPVDRIEHKLNKRMDELKELEAYYIHAEEALHAYSKAVRKLEKHQWRVAKKLDKAEDSQEKVRLSQELQNIELNIKNKRAKIKEYVNKIAEGNDLLTKKWKGPVLPQKEYTDSDVRGRFQT
ncbi:hypothetical protein JXA85_08175 [Candidatus Woesearchaeota archaeon]|nr:hypothetical protein [Candidatus Woesearchaeota archaeon]